jgi:hypothetical protein
VTNPKEMQIMSVTSEPSAETKPMQRSAKPLSVYLKDHLADETRGLELVRRAISENKGTRLGTFLELLGWELEEDRESLVALMGRLGVHRGRVGVVVPRIAEKVGRPRLARNSALSTLAKLETLDLRINAKLDMWNALRSGVADRVDGIDFDELIRRAERQADALERRRLDVAAAALSHRHGSAAVRPPSTSPGYRGSGPRGIWTSETPRSLRGRFGDHYLRHGHTSRA